MDGENLYVLSLNKKLGLVLDSVNVPRMNDDNFFYYTNRFGGASNYTQFSTDGTLTQAGTATTFEDLVFEMTPGRLGALTKPDWDATNIGFLMPKNDATEILYVVAQIPHKYKAGSTIYPHCHVIQSRNEQAVMKLDYKWFNIGDTIPADFTTYTMGTYAISYSSGSTHQILKGSGITGTGKTLSSILIIKLYRDDNVYDADLLLQQFDIHIETDSLGSSTEYTK